MILSGELRVGKEKKLTASAPRLLTLLLRNNFEMEDSLRSLLRDRRPGPSSSRSPTAHQSR